MSATLFTLRIFHETLFFTLYWLYAQVLETSLCARSPTYCYYRVRLLLLQQQQRVGHYRHSDNKLKFKSHLKNLCKKASQKMWAFSYVLGFLKFNKLLKPFWITYIFLKLKNFADQTFLQISHRDLISRLTVKQIFCGIRFRTKSSSN